MCTIHLSYSVHFGPARSDLFAFDLGFGTLDKKDTMFLGSRVPFLFTLSSLYASKQGGGCAPQQELTPCMHTSE
jgi:hypothetical protein